VGARVHDPHSWEIQPERQRQEPVDQFVMQCGIVLDLGEKRRVLPAVALAPLRAVARTQVFTRLIRIRRVPGNRIQLVVAHDGERRSRVHHPAGDGHRANLRGTAIDEVADEDRRPFGVAPGAGSLAVSQRAQQRFELVGLAVDVTDDVVH